MRLRTEKIKKIIKNNKINLKTLLERAGVSKTAYYHLSRQDTLLPKSLYALAEVLEVPPGDLVEDRHSAEARIRRLRKKQTRIISRHPGVDPENIWHTLVLLEKSPWERLERGLLRAQSQNLHR